MILLLCLIIHKLDRNEKEVISVERTERFALYLLHRDEILLFQAWLTQAHVTNRFLPEFTPERRCDSVECFSDR